MYSILARLVIVVLPVCLAAPSPGFAKISQTEKTLRDDARVNWHAAPPRGVPLLTGGWGKPRLKLKIEPAYPWRARRTRLSGTVLLEVIVNENGDVYSARVVRGHRMLNQAALDAILRWKYAPFLWMGQPVSVLITVTLVFKPPGSKRTHGDSTSILGKDL